MPRQLRLEYEGAVYHVMARGDRREAIYHEDGDRLAWVDYLNQVCRRTEWRVYGWMLMGNHYHLLVETPRANLVSGMQWLQTAYTVWFNRRHNLSGHLFGGRYKAVLIDEGEPQGKMLYGYVGTALVGNRGVEGLLKSGVIQAKLKVNEPGDIYEQEADRIAGQVLAAPTRAPVGTAPGIQRVAGQPLSETATAPASVEHALASAGNPLEPGYARKWSSALTGTFRGCACISARLRSNPRGM
jgi:REP element-mobilizing transposase RayT